MASSLKASMFSLSDRQGNAFISPDIKYKPSPKTAKEQIHSQWAVLKKEKETLLEKQQ